MTWMKAHHLARSPQEKLMVKHLELEVYPGTSGGNTPPNHPQFLSEFPCLQALVEVGAAGGLLEANWNRHRSPAQVPRETSCSSAWRSQQLQWLMKLRSDGNQGLQVPTRFWDTSVGGGLWFV